MGDIDQIIAGGAGSSSRADFSGIPGIADAYWAGKDQRAKNDLRDAFKGGVPLTSDGQPDFSAMAKTLFQKGGLTEGTAAANLGLAQQNQQFGQGQSKAISTFEGGQPQPSAQPIVGPSTSRNTVMIDPSKRPDSNPQPQAPQQPQQQPTVMTVLSAQGIPNNQLQAAAESVARQLGTNPMAPLDVNDPRVRNVLAPAIAQLKRAGIGEVVQPQGQPQPQPPQGQPAPVTNQVTTTQAPATPSRVDQGIAFYAGIMSDPRSPKQNVELAKDRLKALQENSSLTPDQKNYSQAVLQGFKGTMQDFLSEQEAGKAASTERAKADVKEQQTYIDAGKAASQRLGTLNALSNIISSDKNLTLGFGAETALKAKMALQQLGINVGDLSGAEAIQKLNASLASEMTKALASRPTQFEFKTFLANNPGLLLDKSGNERLISLFSQLAKRETDLGKLARKNQDNWQNWDTVVENYDKQEKNQIRDPVTKKVLSTDSIIAPGPAGGRAASASGTAQAATMVSSKADYDKLPSGAKFTGPDGKPWQKP